MFFFLSTSPESFAPLDRHCWKASDIDPRGRPTLMAGSDHYFRTWCLSVRPSSLFKISKKQNNFQVRIVIATGGIVGLADWIIDGTQGLT